MTKLKLINKPVKRLFTFGCSFTGYAWSTWPEIIAYDLNIPLYNYGASGAGNQYIFNMLIQANNFYKFNQDDLIIICWTNVMREDRYINGRWIITGNIHQMGFYNENFIKKYSDPFGYLIRDLAFMQAADDILSKIGCQYHFLSMNKFIENFDQFSTASFQETETSKNLKNLYQNVLTKINKSFYEVLWNNDINNKIKLEEEMLGKNFGDRHPTPLEHLQYLENIFDHNFSEITKKEVENVFNRWYMLCKTLSKNKQFFVYRLEKSTLNQFIEATTLKKSEPIYKI